MSQDDSQDYTPTYSFQGSSPADALYDIARIHYREAKQLEDNARTAEAEGRTEEAKLLKDLAIARKATADEFIKAAKGETGDPIVTEILDWQEDLSKNYTPHTPISLPSQGKLPDDFLAEFAPPPQGPIARFMAWIGGWFTK
jgi:hypothetical protein